MAHWGWHRRLCISVASSTSAFCLLRQCGQPASHFCYGAFSTMMGWMLLDCESKRKKTLSSWNCFLLGILLQHPEINRYNVNNYIDMQTTENSFYCYYHPPFFFGREKCGIIWWFLYHFGFRVKTLQHLRLALLSVFLTAINRWHENIKERVISSRKFQFVFALSPVKRK